MATLDPLTEIARFLRRLQWAALGLALCWLLWLLSPVLSPFVLGALLGWLGDPLVDRLERAGRSRNVAVLLVFTAMSFLVVLGLVLLVPMIQEQITTLIAAVPGYQQWVISQAMPWIEARTGVEITGWLDINHLVELVRANWEKAGGFASNLLGYMSRSGFALIALAANIALLPVVTFFALRDWDLLVARVTSLIPRDHLETVTRLAHQSSDVLSAFLRGQFLVMLALGVIYAVGLWGVGLDLGLLIGIIGGILTFIPYVGPATVLVLGCIAAIVQYGDWQHVVAVLVVFGVGQLVESYWLTPKLVGDRIGLHPVAVIFAVLAGGQLFGFLGMLMALPCAAVANVLLRYAEERYTHSRLYAGAPAPVIVVGDEPPPPPASSEPHGE